MTITPSTLIAPYGDRLVDLIAPYEPPLHPEIILDTIRYSPEENARLILEYLLQKGFVRGSDGSVGG